MDGRKRWKVGIYVEYRSYRDLTDFGVWRKKAFFFLRIQVWGSQKLNDLKLVGYEEGISFFMEIVSKPTKVEDLEKSSVFLKIGRRGRLLWVSIVLQLICFITVRGMENRRIKQSYANCRNLLRCFLLSWGNVALGKFTEHTLEYVLIEFSGNVVELSENESRRKILSISCDLDRY